MADKLFEIFEDLSVLQFGKEHEFDGALCFVLLCQQQQQQRHPPRGSSRSSGSPGLLRAAGCSVEAPLPARWSHIEK